MHICLYVFTTATSLPRQLYAYSNEYWQRREQEYAREREQGRRQRGQEYARRCEQASREREEFLRQREQEYARQREQDSL